MLSFLQFTSTLILLSLQPLFEENGKAFYTRGVDVNPSLNRGDSWSEIHQSVLIVHFRLSSNDFQDAGSWPRLLEQHLMTRFQQRYQLNQNSSLAGLYDVDRSHSLVYLDVPFSIPNNLDLQQAHQKNMQGLVRQLEHNKSVEQSC